MKTGNTFTFAALFLLFAATPMPAQNPARPDVPAKLAAPANEEVVLIAHASGSQVYVSRQGPTKSFRGR
jgi:hypothetical protein